MKPFRDTPFSPYVAVVALAIVGAFVLYTALTRLSEGRCRLGGRGAKGISGMDCTYPAPDATTTGAASR